MAAGELIFKMTFLKSTSSSELISYEMWDLEQQTKEVQYLCTIGYRSTLGFFFKSNIVKMVHFLPKISSKLFIK